MTTLGLCFSAVFFFTCTEENTTKWNIREATLQQNHFNYHDKQIKKIDDEYRAYFDVILENYCKREKSPKDPMRISINLAVGLAKNKKFDAENFANCEMYEDIAIAIIDLEYHIFWKDDLLQKKWNALKSTSPGFLIMYFILENFNPADKIFSELICSLTHYVDGEFAEAFFETIENMNEKEGTDPESTIKHDAIKRIVNECVIWDPNTGQWVNPRFMKSESKGESSTIKTSTQ